jgi:hypothetical protein
LEFSGDTNPYEECKNIAIGPKYLEKFIFQKDALDKMQDVFDKMKDALAK